MSPLHRRRASARPWWRKSRRGNTLFSRCGAGIAAGAIQRPSALAHCAESARRRAARHAGASLTPILRGLAATLSPPQVEVADRVGLLHDVTQALWERELTGAEARQGAESGERTPRFPQQQFTRPPRASPGPAVHRAHVSTSPSGNAVDLFYVTGAPRHRPCQKSARGHTGSVAGSCFALL